MAATQALLEPDRILTRTFRGRSPAGPVGERAITEEAQAALRQFSLERLMAYGVDHADAVELRGRVAAGEAWRSVATELSHTCLAPPEAPVAPETSRTKANRLYRASALLRMSQMMMLEDDADRRGIVAAASALYRKAADITRDRRQLVIPTDQGDLSGWLYPASGEAHSGCAVVIGGVEGWAMDFGSLGVALAERGVETLLLDGPGQGESRLIHGHTLTMAWQRSYGAVFDFLKARNAGAPLAFVGNSMGGSVAMHLAAVDPRISACCDNGGPLSPERAREKPSFFRKMIAHCGDVDEATAADIWRTINPTPQGATVRCPLLIVQGGLDPLVPMEDAHRIFEWATSADKQMVIFSDGDHCVYNHQADKHDLIADWVADRLRRASGR